MIEYSPSRAYQHEAQYYTSVNQMSNLFAAGALNTNISPPQNQFNFINQTQMSQTPVGKDGSSILNLQPVMMQPQMNMFNQNVTAWNPSVNDHVINGLPCLILQN